MVAALDAGGAQRAAEAGGHPERRGKTPGDVANVQQPALAMQRRLPA